MARRLVALGASNLTRGFGTLVATARSRWGPDTEILAALGHGRSFGQESYFIYRALPGILECGIWRELERLPPAPTRAIITDVGNDILYGVEPDRILEWVGRAIERLRPAAEEIVLTGLPLESAARLTRGRYLFFRTLFFPRNRMPLWRVLEAAGELGEGVERVARETGARFFKPPLEWYGRDPIHVLLHHWPAAWLELTGAGPAIEPVPESGLLERIRLYLRPPQRQRILGHERHTPQTGRDGIKLY